MYQVSWEKSFDEGGKVFFYIVKSLDLMRWVKKKTTGKLHGKNDFMTAM